MTKILAPATQKVTFISTDRYDDVAAPLQFAPSSL
jgi:hypothetical protein